MWSTTAANQLLPNASDVLGDSSIASRLSLPAVNVTDGGTYTCVISNEAGSATATTGLLIVPEILSQPFNITTSAGVTRSLTCLAVGFPEPTYHWEKLMDGNRDLLNMSAGGPGLMDVFGVLNVTSRELNFDPVGYEDFGVYRCVVFNVAGVIVSDRATVAGTTSHKHTHARTHTQQHNPKYISHNRVISIGSCITRNVRRSITYIVPQYLCSVSCRKRKSIPRERDI